MLLSLDKEIAWLDSKRCEPGEAQINARLIAAAPELLKALQAIEAMLDGRQPKDVPGAVMVARSAIAKAESRQ